MKVKLSQLVNSVEALNKLSEEKLKSTVAFALAVNMRNVDPIVKEFSAQRQQLVDDNSIEDESGDKMIDPEKLESVNEELKELLEEEVDVTIKKVPAAKLPDMTPADIMRIDYLIK
jgi:hypothetical protein